VRAFDARSGALRWTWDPLPGHPAAGGAKPPALFTAMRGGKPVPGVAVGSKTGHLFLLDRETGRPLFPVEERGSINLGGPLATAGGLVFIGASLDPAIRAFDATSGAELWLGALPASARSVPMTFQGRAGAVRRDRRRGSRSRAGSARQRGAGLLP